VEEHDFCATLPDGSEFRSSGCVVATVSGDRIAGIREYIDLGAAAHVQQILRGE
jgi:ketosteroid isomerase-like protein